MGMGFLWDSLGNGSSFGLLMGMGIRIVRMGMGVAYFIGKKINFIGKKIYFIGKIKIPIHIHRFIITQNVAHLT